MKPIPAKIYKEQALDPRPIQPFVNGLVIFLGVCAILYFGRDILIPVVLAVILSVLIAPAVRLLQRLGSPKALAIAIMVTLTVSVAIGTTFMVGHTLNSLAADLPSYESKLREKAKTLRFAASNTGTIERAANVLRNLQTELDQTTPTPAGPVNVTKPIPVEIHNPTLGPLEPILKVVATVAHPLAQAGIMVLMLTFILFYREDLRNRLIRLAGTGDIHRTTLALDEAGHRLSRLFITQLLINSATGLFIGTVLLILGVPGAVLWGILTTVLRFVPYVGTILASIFPIIIALAVGDGWSLALLTASVIIVTEVIVGHVLEPFFFGRMTGVSPVAVVVSAAFWTALWGPIGLILATPITIGLLVVGRHIETLSFLEVILGTETVLAPDHLFYQRILAGDALEAAEQALEYEEDERLADFLSDVAVPGLLLAHRDQSRGVLSKSRAQLLAETFSESLEEVWPAEAEAAHSSSAIALVPAHGALNFSATVAVSALFQLRGIPHTMLNEKALAPTRDTDEDERRSVTILCYLVSPSPAQHAYLMRRASSRWKGAKIMSCAWSSPPEAASLQAPQDLAAILPSVVQESVGQSSPKRTVDTLVNTRSV